MKTFKQKSKSTNKYLLANYEGYEIHLSVTTPLAKEQKHYLEYNNGGRKKDYAKGEIKRKYLNFIDTLSLENTYTHAQFEAKLVYFSKSIHPVSFQTVQPDEGFFFLGPFHPAGSKAA